MVENKILFKISPANEVLIIEQVKSSGSINLNPFFVNIGHDVDVDVSYTFLQESKEGATIVHNCIACIISVNNSIIGGVASPTTSN